MAGLKFCIHKALQFEANLLELNFIAYHYINELGIVAHWYFALECYIYSWRTPISISAPRHSCTLHIRVAIRLFRVPIANWGSIKGELDKRIRTLSGVSILFRITD